MKKILELFMFTMITFIGMTTVKAEKNENLIYTKYDKESGVNIYAEDVTYGSMDYNSWMIVSDTDNKIYYCIEPEYPTLGKNESYRAYTIYRGEDIVNNSRLTTTSKEKVQLLSYYGYGFKNHNDKKWYGITQVMIWREVVKANGRNINWVFKKTRNSTPDNNLYLQEVNELQSLVDNHGKKPSFDGLEIKVSLNESIKLVDDNNAIKNFLISKSDYVDIKEEGNALIITGKKIGKDEIKLTNDIGIKEEYQLYSSSKQDIITRGRIIPLESIFLVEVEGGTVTLNKKDKETNSTTPQGDAALLNAKYVITNENDEIITEVIIDKQNKKIELPYGKYKIKEIEAPNGYKLNEEINEFEINETNKEVNLDLYDLVIKGTHIINKYKGGAGEEFTLEKDCIFEVRDKNNNVVGTIKTYKNGVGTIKLPFGKYTIYQIKGTDNYSFIAPYEIEITKDQEEIEIDLKNIKYSKLIIKKIDSITKEALPGAKFELYNENDILIYSGITDENGLLIAENLKIGKYYIKEVESPKYYVNNENKIYFNVNDNGLVIEKEIENNKGLGKLKIIKKDKENNTYLKNVKFNIYEFNTNKLLYEGITNEDGNIILELPYGKYYLIEVESLEGYKNNSNKTIFEITDETELEITIYNEKEERNPDTKDNILGYFVLTLISIFSITTIFISVNKKN